MPEPTRASPSGAPAAGGRTATPIEDLASAVGIEPAYRDSAGVVRRVPPDTLVTLLARRGHDLDGPADAARALDEWRDQQRRRRLPAVVVAWDGHLPALPVAVGMRRDRGPAVRCRLDLEHGEVRTWITPVADGPDGHALARLGGPASPADPPLPTGRHRLTLDDGVDRQTADVLSAPRRVHAGPLAEGGRPWGVFHPTATLWSRFSRAIGDVGDLGRLADWSASCGADVVGTLPLLATFPGDPSPYAPVSRRFWNEVHVDLDAVPAGLWDAAGVEHADLRPEPPASLVDHDEALRLRRGPLEALGAWLLGDGSDTEHGRALAAHVDAHPDLLDYAQFRAALDQGERSASAPERRVRYHVVAQWLAQRQLDELAERLASRGQCLYLDLPVGCHPDGFDVWSQPELFADGVSAGAPPDDFFAGGQDWGFRPVDPAAGSRDRWRHLEACVDHQLAVAGVLRIDHVMALHRLFWVPDGASPAAGAYVRYPTDEVVAVLSMVSHRRGAAVVGEDLGTVPPEVDRLLADHAIRGMYVVEFEVAEGRDDPLYPVTPGHVASIGTHDLPTLAGWWEGRDLAVRRRLGQLDRDTDARLSDERRVAREALARLLPGPDGRSEQVPAGLLTAVLARLGASEAGLVLADLADLWGEREQVNLPGTVDEHPNWRRRAAVAVDELERLEGVTGRGGVLTTLDEARRRAAATVAPVRRKEG